MEREKKIIIKHYDEKRRVGVGDGYHWLIQILARSFKKLIARRKKIFADEIAATKNQITENERNDAEKNAENERREKKGAFLMTAAAGETPRSKQLTRRSDLEARIASHT